MKEEQPQILPQRNYKKKALGTGSRNRRRWSKLAERCPDHP